jgi:sugar lactone lactonase YvrE
LSPPHGYRGGGISDPIWIAIDGAGNVWVYDLAGVPTCGGVTNFDLSELDPNGNPISPQLGYPIAPPPTCGGSEPWTESPPDGLSIDPSGNIWLANVGNDALLEIVGAAAPVKTPLIGPAQSP